MRRSYFNEAFGGALLAPAGMTCRFAIPLELLGDAALFFSSCIHPEAAGRYLATNKYSINMLISREIKKPACHGSIGLLSTKGARRQDSTMDLAR